MTDIEVYKELCEPSNPGQVRKGAVVVVTRSEPLPDGTVLEGKTVRVVQVGSTSRRGTVVEVEAENERRYLLAPIDVSNPNKPQDAVTEDALAAARRRNEELEAENAALKAVVSKAKKKKGE